MPILDREITTVTDIATIAQARSWTYHPDPEATKQTRLVDVSRTLPDVALDVLHRMPQYVEMFYARGWKSADYIAQKYFARLYSVSPEPMIQTFTCEIPDVTLLSSYGVAVSAQGDLLAQSTQYRDVRDIRVLAAIHSHRTPFVLPDGVWVSLLSYSADNYSHWLNDCLVRLMLIDDLSDPALRFIIPHHAHSFHYEFLALLGIHEDRIYRPTELHPALFAPRFLLTYVSKSIAHSHPVLKQRLTQCLFKRLHIVQPSHARRLYVSRAQATRRVVNESELLPILDDHGFELYFPEHHPVAEQIQTFAQTAVVAGVHGSGLYNIQFCKPGAQLLEVYNRVRWEVTTHRIASLFGHQHWHLYGDNMSADHATHIDPALFRCWLEAVFTL